MAKMMVTTTVVAMQQHQGVRLHVDESDMFGSACLGVGLSLALAAGLGDLEVSLEGGCELVGEGAGVAPGFPPLSLFLLSSLCWSCWSASAAPNAGRLTGSLPHLTDPAFVPWSRSCHLHSA